MILHYAVCVLPISTLANLNQKYQKKKKGTNIIYNTVKTYTTSTYQWELQEIKPTTVKLQAISVIHAECYINWPASLTVWK
jgi:hypothetical protein